MAGGGCGGAPLAAGDVTGPLPLLALCDGGDGASTDGARPTPGLAPPLPVGLSVGIPPVITSNLITSSFNYPTTRITCKESAQLRRSRAVRRGPSARRRSQRFDSARCARFGIDERCAPVVRHRLLEPGARPDVAEQHVAIRASPSAGLFIARRRHRRRRPGRRSRRRRRRHFKLTAKIQRKKFSHSISHNSLRIDWRHAHFSAPRGTKKKRALNSSRETPSGIFGHAVPSLVNV